MKNQCFSGVSLTVLQSRLEDSWTPEAQEAYRLFVECGVNLREASTSPQPSPARSNGYGIVFEIRVVVSIFPTLSLSPARDYPYLEL